MAIWRARPGGCRRRRSSLGRPGRRRRCVVSRATVGVIQPRLAAIAPPPASSTTVGLPVPVQLRCRRCPPTSTSRPGIGMLDASAAVPHASGSRRRRRRDGHGTDERGRAASGPACCRGSRWMRDDHPERRARAGRVARPSRRRGAPRSRGPAGVRPLAPSTRAGAAAQRCGWSVSRVESTARIAQPIAKPHRTAPVSALSLAGTTGAATRTTAARSPATTEPATTGPRHVATGGEPTGARRVLCCEEDEATFGVMRVWVVMAGSGGCGGGERLGPRAGLARRSFRGSAVSRRGATRGWRAAGSRGRWRRWRRRTGR